MKEMETRGRRGWNVIQEIEKLQDPSGGKKQSDENKTVNCNSKIEVSESEKKKS